MRTSSRVLARCCRCRGKQLPIHWLTRCARLAGALTQTQRGLGIRDSPQQFEDDTLKSAAGLGGKEAPPYTPPLAHVLTHESGPAVDWLQQRFKLDLSKVSRLGGHSQPRTHRGKERFPGFAITYALMEALEEVEKKTQGKLARILTKARVTRLLSDDAGRVVGVEYEQDGQTRREQGAVIIATGGFAADFSPDGVLASVRPDLLSLPTTNGEHCTGDGIKLASAINAGTVDLASVQVHPTGLVHPDEPDAKVKWLAAEALRGVGGIMLDGKGERFVDELGRRDFVSGEMTKRSGPFRLVLNEAAAREIEWHCKHYIGRGVMRKYRNAPALAADIGIRPSALQSTFDAYNKAAARGSGDPFGRKFFNNAPFRTNEELHVALITPVVHYCMGGLEISPQAHVLRAGATSGEVATPSVIPGLFAAGEVAGGIHGRNRLGGNSLLDCVVFGRVAGASAARYLFDLAMESPQRAPQQQGQQSGAGAPFPDAVASETAKATAKLPDSSDADYADVPPEQRKLDPHAPSAAGGDVPTTWPRAEAKRGDAAATFVAPGEGKGNSALPEVRTSDPDIDPRWPPVKEPGNPAPHVIESGANERKGDILTLEEVAKHNKPDDCWVILNGRAYDVTEVRAQRRV